METKLILIEEYPDQVKRPLQKNKSIIGNTEHKDGTVLRRGYSPCRPCLVFIYTNK